MGQTWVRQVRQRDRQTERSDTAGFGAVDVSSASEALFGGLASSLRCFIPTKEAEKNKLSISSCSGSLSSCLARVPQNLGKAAGLLAQRCACV